MCGIVGYVGAQQAAPILLDGLRRLEYRGYDSAGMAVCGPEGLRVCKTKGRLQALAELTEEGRAVPGTLGVGHTRWATHGEPNDINAHPQVSENGLFAVVHNGIIENYALLRAQLTKKGYTFRSQTDTEVVAQLLAYYYAASHDLFEAVNSMLSAVEGAYALGIVCADAPSERSTSTSTGTWTPQKRAATITSCSRRYTSSLPPSPAPLPAASRMAAWCSAT